MLRFLGLTALMLIAESVGHAADKPIDVPVSKLGTQFRLIGELSEPLGTVMTVQATVVRGYRKVEWDGVCLQFHRINGRLTQVPSRIMLGNDPSSLTKLELGKTYEFEGYESGEFVGTPREADTFGSAIQGFYFSTKFIAHEAKQIDPVRWLPSEFVGREALIAGRAVSVGDKAYIVGDGWQLLVDVDKAWPKNCKDKLVEGFGTIQKTDQKATYRLEKGTTRLVRLADQIGQPVALRGTAWSNNGIWWFDYRGVRLFVEEMERLPSVKSELHGEPVLVTGVLEEAMLANIEQIGIKEKPDQKKYFIVRKPTVKRIEALLGPELGKP